MTTQPSPSDAEAPPQPPARLRLQYIKDLSYENPRGPFLRQPTSSPLTPMVGVEVRMNQIEGSVGGSICESELTLRLRAFFDDELVMLVELVYAGLFDVPDKGPEYIARYMMIDAPAILFPFARNIMMQLTANSGFPPVMIEPMDFAELFERSSNNKFS